MGRTGLMARLRRPYEPLIEEAPIEYRVGRRVGYTVCKWWFRATWEGLEHIPVTGPAIIAPNHVSFIDPFLCATVVPRRMYFFVLKQFTELPVFGSWLTKAGGFPVDPDEGGAGSARVILSKLKQGFALGMFPEGTRSYDGNLLEPRAGIGLLVAAADTPVIPVHISGAYQAWSRHHRIPRPRACHVRFGPPVDLSELREKMRTDRPTRRATQEAMAQAVMDAIGALAPARGDGRSG
jgi:1-acyl-sn-glycerol-3-phosphate acyltransferase